MSQTRREVEITLHSIHIPITGAGLDSKTSHLLNADLIWPWIGVTKRSVSVAEEPRAPQQSPTGEAGTVPQPVPGDGQGLSAQASFPGSLPANSRSRCRYIRHWCDWAGHSGLEPFRKLARTIHAHRWWILHWFRSKMINGLLEGINSMVQAVKAKAREYGSIENLITMVYLIAGKLDFGVDARGAHMKQRGANNYLRGLMHTIACSPLRIVQPQGLYLPFSNNIYIFSPKLRIHMKIAKMPKHNV